MKLNLGCGAHLRADYLNIDMSGLTSDVSGFFIKHDLTQGLPRVIADNSVDFIFSEHFIEHIGEDAAKRLITDCHRALKPGGKIRVSTPDLSYLVDNYTKWGWNGEPIAKRIPPIWTPATPCKMVNEGMRAWGHMFLYDLNELLLLFRKAGFGNAGPVGYDPAFEQRPFYGEVIVQATKLQ